MHPKTTIFSRLITFLVILTQVLAGVSGALPAQGALAAAAAPRLERTGKPTAASVPASERTAAAHPVKAAAPAAGAAPAWQAATRQLVDSAADTAAPEVLRPVRPQSVAAAPLAQQVAFAIGNTVWKDTNANGLQDSGEPGIPGVTVGLYDSSGNPVLCPQANSANLALNQATDQSGVFQVGNEPGKAVDGNTASGAAITENLENSWWQVDLGESTALHQVVIYPRPDGVGHTQTEQIYVEASNQPFASTALNATLNDPNVWSSALQPAWTEASLTVLLPSYVARYVRIQHGNKDFLALGEVQVFGASVFPVTTVTDANGHYTFTDVNCLQPNTKYAVRIATDQTAALLGLYLTRANAGGVTSNDPIGDDTDSDATSVIISNTVTAQIELTSPAELGVNDSYDFGFMPVEIGNYVWKDLDSNGVQDSGEPGIPGVTVGLYDSSGNPVLCPQASSTNLALNQKAAQSGLYDAGYEASKAVDGNTTSGQSITQVTANSWWQVDLGQSAALRQVVLYARPDRSHYQTEQIYVEVANQPFASTELQATLDDPNVWHSLLQGAWTGASLTVLLPGYVGRYVRIQHGNTDYLALGEVQVFGASVFPVTTVTDASGHYTFTGFNCVRPAVTYQVRIATDQTAALLGLYLTRANAGGVTSNDPINDDTDSDATSVIISNTVYARIGLTSPAAGGVNDSYDFGFMPVEIGNYVWKDLDGNGVQDSGEPGIPGVTVGLYDSSGNPVRCPQASSTNLALNQVTAQSGLYDTGYEASRAVDGNTASGAAITQNLENSWWQVDLGQSAALRQVVLYARPDGYHTQTEQIYVEVANQPFASTELQATLDDPNVWHSLLQGAWTGASLTVLLPGYVGRYVRIQHGNTGYLALGEVQVFGASLLPVTTVTDASGHYTFTGFNCVRPAVTYQVRIATDQTALLGMKLAPANTGGVTSNDSKDDNTDSDATSVTISNTLYAQIDLTSPVGGVNDSYDFGFAPVKIGVTPVEIGNYVWKDLDGNGVQGSGEPGIPGVTVGLYDGNGNPVRCPQASAVQVSGAPLLPVTAVTDANGHYTFTDVNCLQPNTKYAVRIATDQMAALLGLYLTRANAGGVTSNDPKDDDTDSDATSVIISNTVTAQIELTSPTGGVNDSYDFGFMPVEIGNYVWKDLDGNGVQDSGEPGIPGVTVGLYDSSGNPVLCPQASSTNLALNQVTAQSGRFDTGYEASRAVDGNTASGAAITQNLENSWWQVDLGQSAALRQVVIYARPDGYHSQTEQIYVEASNQPFASTELQATLNDPNVWHSLLQGAWTGASLTVLLPGYVGRYVRIQHGNTDYLALGEVQVFGASVFPVTTVTDASGHYTFTGFNCVRPAVTYQVRIATDQTAALLGLYLTRANAGGVTSNDPINDDTDSDATSVIISNTVYARIGLTSPAAGGVNDSYDFGFMPVEIGNYVWKDLDGNGVQDSGEPGIPGVTVGLYDSSGNPVRCPQASSTNLALNQVTAQSGLYDTGYEASRAVDGNTASGAAITQNLENSWWQVDLGQSAALRQVVLYARPDGYHTQTEQIYVEVANQPFASTELQATLDDPNVWHSLLQGAWTGASLTVLLPGYVGRYVRIQHGNTGYLALGEVQVFGASLLPVTTVTDASGHYTFTGFNCVRPAVTYQVRIATDQTALLGMKLAPANTGGVTSNDSKDDNTDSDATSVTISNTLYAQIDLTSPVGGVNDSYDFGFAPVKIGVTPVEIGNYVWKDLDGNGVQDSGEPGIPGVTVGLYDGNGNPVRCPQASAVQVSGAPLLPVTAVTDANGHYTFTDVNCLQPNTKYAVRIATDQMAALLGLYLTRANAGGVTSNDPINDDTDSDATSVIISNTVYAQIELTSPTGGVNDSYDFGFAPLEIGNYVWQDTNGNGVQDSGEPGIPGVTVGLYDGSGNAVLCPQASAVQVSGASLLPVTTVTDANGHYTFTGFNCVQPSTNYEVRISTEQPALLGMNLALANAGGVTSNDPTGDDTDSDATLVTISNILYARIKLTSPEGGVNDSYDFGFIPMKIGFVPLEIGNYVWKDLDGNGVQDSGEPGIPGVTVGLYDSSGNPVLCGQTSNVNLALNHTATQSDVINAGNDASNAVDGNTTSGAAITQNTLNSWWQVDLGQSAVLRQVVIYAVPDGPHSQTEQIYVEASNQPFASTELQATFADPNVWHSARQPAWTGSSLTVAVPNYLGRYVRIQHSNTDSLALGEVQVFGASNNRLPVTAVTDAGGHYTFTDANCVQPSTKYAVRIATNQTVLLGLNLTMANAGGVTSNDPTGDDTDSDATSVTLGNTVYARIDLTSPPGGVNDSYDFGFAPLEIGNYVWKDLDGNGLQDSGEPGIPGVTVGLYDSSGNPVLCPQASSVNLALNQKATQSSTYPGGYDASKAVDGNTASGAAITQNLANSWWQVDLGQSTALRQVVLYARPDGFHTQTEQIYVEVANQPFASTALNATLNDPNVWSSEQKAWTGASLTVAVPRYTGRYVRIQHSNADFLALGEVQVFGDQFLPVTAVTDANGHYTFTGFNCLRPSTKYAVRIATNQTALLELYLTRANAGGVTSDNPKDDDTDSDATSVTLGNIRYAQIDLTSPPGGVNDSYDFGFIPVKVGFMPVEIGNYVWKDLNDNGVQDGGEPGIPGVTVGLYDDSGNPVLCGQTSSVNLALNQKATQSSDYQAIYPASNAVDGNTGGVPAITQNLENSWWQVDLGQSTTLRQVVIYARQDGGSHLQTEQIYVEASNQPFASTDLQVTLADSTLWHSSRQQAWTGSSLTVAVPSYVGRYVRIQHSNTDSLALGEVQVFGASNNRLPVTAVTDAGGHYTFTDANCVQPSTKYAVRIATNQTVLLGLNLALANAGGVTSNDPTGDDTDSDATFVTIGNTPYAQIELTSPVGGVNDSYDFGFAPFEIGNTVWQDTNANGVQDSGEPGIPGVTVGLYDSSGNPVLCGQTSSANLALNQKATQSDTYPGGYEASNAVDGNTTSGAAITQATLNSWWQVDLGQSAVLRQVVIYARPDGYHLHAEYIYVEASNQPFASTALNATLNDPNVWSSALQPAWTGASLTVTVPRYTGRYVRIQHSNQQFLGLGEVQVFGNPVLPVTTVTDANGHYTFTGFNCLQPNTKYKVRIATNQTALLGLNLALANAGGVTSNDPTGDDTDSDATFVTIGNTPYAQIELTSPGRGVNDSYDFGFAPFEIGNTVWQDTNANGVQDSGEPGIPGVTVGLYDDSGNPVLCGQTSSVNLALNQKATQSDTYPGGYEASNAVDGNTTSGAAITQATLNSWWQVDLGQSAVLRQVVIYARPDGYHLHAEYIYVEASNQPFASTALNATLNDPNVWSSALQPAWTGASLTVTVPRYTGRYVRIQHSNQQFLGLGEVQVFGNPVLPVTTVTDANGHYTFTGFNCLQPNTKYKVRIATNQTVLLGLNLTMANAGGVTSNDPIGDDTDSDATSVTLSNTVYAQIGLTSPVGGVNDSYDFGFVRGLR